MKYIRSLFYLLIVLFFLTNCKKNNDDFVAGSNNYYGLNGFWIIDSTIFSYYNNDSIQYIILMTESPSYINFFNSYKAYYRGNNISDTTNYYLFANDSILIDLNDDNILDSVKINTLMPQHKIILDWTTKYGTSKNVEQIFIHK